MEFFLRFYQGIESTILDSRKFNIHVFCEEIISIFPVLCFLQAIIDKFLVTFGESFPGMEGSCKNPCVLRHLS